MFDPLHVRPLARAHSHPCTPQLQPLMEEFRHVSSEFSDLALSLQAKVDHYWSRHEALLPPGPAHPLQRLPPEHDPLALAPEQQQQAVV